MSYWKSISKNTRQLDSFGLATNHTVGGGTPAEFYEMELGIVLDIVLDDKHPVFSNKSNVDTKIDANRWPEGIDGKAANPEDTDYTWIGRALVRPLVSDSMTNKDQLPWAYPLDSNISEYPLINETVILITQNGRLYYTKKVNQSNWPNNNLNFAINKTVSGHDNTELYTINPYTGKQESVLKAPTKTVLSNNTGYKGYAGKYFVANNRIRAIRRYEGGLVIESRHGQSIHMTAYDSNRNNDVGDKNYADYKDGHGNPMILIRNRQRPILKVDQTLSLNGPNPATISGTKIEKNVGGYIEEDINHDGSSIHITSGQTISGWVTTCYKKMFGTGEEVEGFDGDSSFTYPMLNGDQIVIQSDRLILSSRYAETFHYSKKRYAIVTDGEYTVDAHDQIVMTTHVKTVLNSPAIYLGEYDQTNEPAMLGQTTVNWLYTLCDWLAEHIHKHEHSHENAGTPSPHTTQIVVDPQLKQLIALRDSLSYLLSKRVFLTGGGFAPGSDGNMIPNITSLSTGGVSSLVNNVPKPSGTKLPVNVSKIDVKTGKGVPGEYSASSSKTPSAEISKISVAQANVAGQISSVISAQGKLDALAKNGIDPNKAAPEAASKLKAAKDKLTAKMAKLKKRASDTAKSAVDFKKAGSLPKIPAAPEISVPKVDVPEIPSVETAKLTVPSAPTLPSAPSFG